MVSGETFPVAWARAMMALEVALADTPKVAAADWRASMRATREGWERAYRGSRTRRAERAAKRLGLCLAARRGDEAAAAQLGLAKAA
jgi:hypothetical protein